MHVLTSVGVSIGLVALFFTLAPGLLDHFVKFNTDSNAFSSVGKDLASAIAKDLGKRFGVIAITCLIVGIAGGIWLKRLERAKLQPARRL